MSLDVMEYQRAMFSEEIRTLLPNNYRYVVTLSGKNPNFCR